jgi:GST-like protein
MEAPLSAPPLPAAETAAPWRLLRYRGWGSSLAEATLTVAGIPYATEDVDVETAAGRERLLAVNPLGQLPTILLPDGGVLTESAAVVLIAAERSPHAGLAPAPSDPERVTFLRWLVFLVAAVYPTFTYGDEPSRWTATAPEELKASTHAHRLLLWKQLEGAVVGPWFLGERFSAIDLYVGIMTHWRPRRAWFAEHCPRLHAVAVAVDQRPELAAVWAANFDPSAAH